MSSKKTFPRSNTPGSGIKGASKPKLAASKQNLNSSFMPRNSPDLMKPLSLNMTMTVGGPSLVPQPVATDWELQCDLAYSSYLRAMLAKRLTQKAIKEYEEAIDDQLSQQAESHLLHLRRNTEIENEIKDAELLLEIKDLYSRLEQSYNYISEISQQYDVDANLSNCIASLGNACNKLYLKNIKCFTVQEDYDKFTLLMQKCTDNMRKLKLTIGNLEEVQVLGEHLKEFLSLRNELVYSQKKLSDLQADVGYSLFKSISDLFAVSYCHDEA